MPVSVEIWREDSFRSWCLSLASSDMLAGGGSASLLNFSPAFPESLEGSTGMKLESSTRVSKNQAQQSSLLPRVSIPEALGLWQRSQRKASDGVKASQRQETVLGQATKPR